MHNLRAGEGFIAGLCTLFMNPARVYQLVDQLRQDFEAGAACKRDTCKALAHIIRERGARRNFLVAGWRG